MAAGTVIVIWLLASELSSTSTAAMANAAREALGTEAEVRVQAAPDPDGMRLADVHDAAGAVRVSWDSAEHRRARLLVYLPKYERWVDRELSFAVEDPELERGRTLGFLVASIFLDAGAVPRANAPSTPPAPEPPTPPPAPGAVPERASPPAATPSATHAADTAVPLARSALAAAVTVAGPGTGTAFGAWLSGSRGLGGGVWLGLAVQARLGEVATAHASSRFLAAGMHCKWQFWSPSYNSWLGVRLQASLAQLSLAHFSAEHAGIARRQRLLPSFELALSSGYGLSAASSLVLDAGAEILGGKTEVYVADQRVATWGRLAAVARLGLETTF